MVPVIARRGRDYQPSQPLDAAAADLARHDDAQGAAVVGPQRGAVHAVGEHDSLVWLRGPVQLEGGAVVAVWLVRWVRSTIEKGYGTDRTRWGFNVSYKLVGAFHADVFCSAEGSRPAQQVGHQRACEEGR